MKYLIFGLFFCQAAFAQVYVGADLGRAYQYGIGGYSSYPESCVSHNMDRRSTIGDVFIGARTTYVGVEGGTGELFHSWFYGTCPGSQGSQTIQASYRYLRVNGYIPVGKLEIMPFIGAAFVKFQNFEDVYAPGYPDNHGTNWTTGKETSPLYGLGLQGHLSEHWLLRGEAQRVEKVAEDYWTARGWHNSVTTFKLGLGYQF